MGIGSDGHRGSTGGFPKRRPPTRPLAIISRPHYPTVHQRSARKVQGLDTASSGRSVRTSGTNVLLSAAGLIAFSAVLMVCVAVHCISMYLAARWWFLHFCISEE